MDFSKGLLNLQQSAARNRNNNSNNTSNQRERSYSNSSSSNYSRNRSNNNNTNNNRYHPYSNHRNDRRNNTSSGLTEAEEAYHLPRLIEAIPKYQPLALPKKNKQRHVALLFLTIDDLPFEHLWRAFLNNYNIYQEEDKKEMGEGTQKDKEEENQNRKMNNITTTNSSSDLMVSVICHAKFPERVKSPWLQQRLLLSNPPANRNNRRHQQKNQQRYQNNNDNRNDHHNNNNNRQIVPRYHTRRPEWGSVDITKAMIDLLEVGLKIGTNKDKLSPDQDERYSSARYVATGEGDGTENNNNAHSTIPGVTTTFATTGHSVAGIATNTASVTSTNNTVLPTVDRFIFISESCLPVVTLEEFEMSLFGPAENTSAANANNPTRSSNTGTYTRSTGTSNSTSGSHQSNQETSKDQNKNTTTPYFSSKDANKSWINARNTPNNGYARQLQWDAMSKAIPQKHIYKADQWIVLTRHHAWPLISLVDEAVKSVKTNSNHNLRLALWQCFRRVKASDEMYFPTAMALLGILDKPDVTDDNDNENSNNIVKESTTRNEQQEKEEEITFRRVTYCDWSMNAKNPASFVIDRNHDAKFKELKQIVRMAREEKCLFARKFVPNLQIGGTSHHRGSHGTARLDQDYLITVQEWVKLIDAVTHDAK